MGSSFGREGGSQQREKVSTVPPVSLIGFDWDSGHKVVWTGRLLTMKKPFPLLLTRDSERDSMGKRF